MDRVLAVEPRRGTVVKALAVARRHRAPLDHGVDAEILEVFDQDQIGAIARRDGAAIDQPVMTGRHVRGVPDRGSRRDAAGHDAAEQAVEVAVTPQIVGEDVVGDQAPRVIELAGRQER